MNTRWAVWSILALVACKQGQTVDIKADAGRDATVADAAAGTAAGSKGAGGIGGTFVDSGAAGSVVINPASDASVVGINPVPDASVVVASMSDASPDLAPLPPPSPGQISLLVDGSAACPTGTSEGERIYSGLSGPGTCSGCSCSAKTVCGTDLYLYPTVKACGDDFVSEKTTPNVATKGAHIENGQACITVSPNKVGGIAVSPFVPRATCETSGTPTAPAPSWDQTRKFCVGPDTVNAVGLRRCVAAVSTCPAGFTQQPGSWYRGYNDTRACAACGCNATPGDCVNTEVYLTFNTPCMATPEYGRITDIDWGHKCSYGDLSGFYAGAQMGGVPGPATCSAATTLAGTLAPKDPVLLCCAP